MNNNTELPVKRQRRFTSRSKSPEITHKEKRFISRSNSAERYNDNDKTRNNNDNNGVTGNDKDINKNNNNYSKASRSSVLEITDEGEMLLCRDCSTKFCFTNGEQDFYKEKGFKNKPSRCKECRIIARNARDNNNMDGGGAGGGGGRRNVNNAPAWMKDGDGNNGRTSTDNYASRNNNNVQRRWSDRRDGNDNNRYQNNNRQFNHRRGGFLNETELHRRREIRLNTPLSKLRFGFQAVQNLMIMIVVILMMKLIYVV